MGYDAAVPTRTAFRLNARGVKVPRTSPIIRGYCFSEFPLDQLSAIKRIHGVRDVLRLGGVIARLTEAEVSAVKTLSETIGNDGPTVSRFKRRQKVKIRAEAKATLSAMEKRLGLRISATVERVIPETGEIEVSAEIFGKTFRGIRVKEEDVETVA